MKQHVHCALILLGVVVAAVSAYASCAADCDDIGWMPVKDAPVRCLRGTRP